MRKEYLVKILNDHGIAAKRTDKGTELAEAYRYLMNSIDAGRVRRKYYGSEKESRRIR